MATIRLCDWLKTKLASNEEVVKVQVGDKEFEVSQEAARSLLERLESDDPPRAAFLHFPPNVRSLEPQERPQPIAPPPQPARIEAAENFDGGPGSMPEPIQAGEEAVKLEIPIDINKRLGVPSRATYERVIQDATRFESGTLPTLSPGSARSDANRKLQEIEAREEAKLARKAGSDINFKTRQ